MIDLSNRLVLIDGHGVSYRQYFALKRAGQKGGAFMTSEGEPTGATYGFARTIIDLLQGGAPKYLCMTFDQGLSGREVAYPAYKAQRAEMENDLVIQLERIRELVQ